MGEVDIIGNQARSREGRGLSVRGGDSDKWITIQKNTFQNWINLQLHGSGLSVDNLQEDLCDGVKLCVLVASLQQKPSIGRVIRKPNNPHQYLENVTLALNAIAADNIRLVNIGSEDIVNGSLKLILGLIWHLILRYQIGKTKFPPKKLMLAWLKAVVPDCHITNFTSDWNDGVNLHAVIEYCQPGLCPEWRQLSRQNRLDNCRNAMMIAKDKFDIPLVVRPEDLASPHLDDLSGMTYLSYFMNVDSPGYTATLRNVNAVNTQGGRINDFTSSWNDGSHLCNLVKSLGQSPGALTPNNVDNIQSGIDCGRRLGVEPILSAKEMSDPEVEHLGIMAYAAYFTHLKPVKSLADKAIIDGNFSNVYVGQEKTFRLNIDDDVAAGDFRAEVIGPDSIPPVRLNWSGRTATGSFTPSEMGQHRLNVYCVNEPLASCPIPFKVSSDRSKVTFHPVDRCPVGVITELKVDTSSAGQGDIRVEVETPNGHSMNLPVVYRQGMYTANFTPAEVGDHRIFVNYDNEQIGGSPFVVKAFDPSKVNVFGLEGGSVGRALSFTADSQTAGEGELSVSVIHNGVTIPSQVIARQNGVHNVDFTPQGAGVYRVQMYYNNVEIRGSPYTLEIVDSSMVSVSGDGLSLVPVNKTASFNVQTRGAGGGNVSVDITSPSGQQVPARISGNGTNGYTVEYTPREIGTYLVSTSLSGIQIKGSPFRVKTYDPSLVKVSKIPQGVVGTPTKFIVDASAAGEGTLEIAVSASGRNIPNQARALGGGRFEVSFVGREATRHKAVLTYNGEHIPGSPFWVDFMDASHITATGEGLSLVPCHRQTHFTVNAPGAALPDLNIRLTGPDGREVPTRIRDVKGDQHYRVEWTPTSIGDYKAVIEYADMPIKGSPFTVKAFDAANVKISKINQGFLGRPNSFTLDASEAGDGNLEIQVTADGESVPNYVRQESDTNFRVSFTPQRPSKHHISVRFNGEPVPGSPFNCSVLDSDRIHVSGEGIKMVPANVLTTFKVDPKGEGDGDLSVRVYSPSGHEVPVRVSGNARSAFRADYTPHDIGPYKVHVEYSGVEIKGSPFTCNVYDPSLIRVTSPGRGYLGRPIHFQIDTSAAGTGDLEAEVKCRGSNVASHIREIGRNRYELSFTPRDLSTHIVTILFNRFPLPGSPYHVDIIDSNSVTMSGEGLHTAQVYKETWFNLDLHGMDENDLEVHITSPSGSEIPCRLSKKGHVCRAEYTPLEVGQHMIDVYFAGTRLQGSPFVSQAYDPSLVRITDVDKTAKKEREIAFTVDASAAGVGDLDAVVTHHGRSIHTYRETIGDGRYRYTFTPTEVGHYDVNVKFNDEQIPGCPVVVNVEEQVPTFITINFRGVEALNVRDRNHFILHMDGHHVDSDALQTRIKAPSGELVPANLVRQSDGDYKVEWTPNMAGRHSVDVLFAGQQIQGSPFFINVFDINKIRVDNFYNGGLEETAGFNVDCSQAGKADQSIWVVSPSGRNVPVDIQENRPAEYAVSYVPHEVGRHKVHLTYGAMEHPGSPFTQEIGEGALATAHGDGLYRGEEDKPATFFVEAGGITGEPTIQVDDYASVEDIRAISLQAEAVGSVEEAADMHISQSSVTRTSVTAVHSHYDEGDMMRQYQVDEAGNEIRDSRDKMYRRSDAVDGDSMRQYQVDEDGFEIEGGGDKMYRRSDAMDGDLRQYEIDEAGFEIEGGGDKMYRKSQVEDDVETTSMIVKMEEEGDLQAAVSSITAVRTSVVMVEGSPFHPRIVDARKVRVIGGWQHYMDSNERIHLVVGEEKHIPFETAEAGPGKLTAEVRGPSGSIVPCTVDDSYNGKSTVIFTPREEGHHNIHLNWSDHPLSGSAFSAFATGGFHDITKIILSGRGLKEATVREEAKFFIDGSQAGRGEPQVQLTGVRAEVNVITSPLGGGKYRCTYIPVIPGAYLLHITWNGRQVKGAPFKVNVIGAFYPNKVAVSGEGLKGGLLGRDLDIRIDTRKAGPGELTAFCSGPNKVAYCDLEDNRDGTFRLLVKAQEPGRHVLQVKYGGEHVLGSPFVFRVSAQPDASKVRVSGPGVEHGILATFQSRFIVETRGAGAGQLMVRIRGPKGAFQVEMYRDSQKDRTILCRFDPTETGLYIIHVKWSNVDVPGSPFQVHIVDTQLELEQVLQEQSYSSNTLPSSRSYSQWREEF
ncbi:filamin-C-like isoform X1 [Haliotis rufescens]|uniref:filamin-C-like isoform X1 n=1 Tax=Haliotis rufescens TaxID=6454 RepID=UPI00201E971F|nr:filamin-C-like isoform X1 [Haliotis rufescens]